MHIPAPQTILTTILSTTSLLTKPSIIASGSVLDFAVEKCIDADGNQRCTKPFPVVKNHCYNVKWSTEGTFSHTTAEIKDAGSQEMVFYRDTDGEWTPKKSELVYMDFKPKVPNTGNSTVEYEVKECEKKDAVEEI